MLATWLDWLIGSELSEPHRAELTLTERISCSVRGFPSQAELRACSVRLGSLPSLALPNGVGQSLEANAKSAISGNGPMRLCGMKMVILYIEEGTMEGQL